jgi:Flp pilus assembly protein TadG
MSVSNTTLPVPGPSPLPHAGPAGRPVTRPRRGRLFGLFWRARRGVAAVEFALLLPVLMLLSLGCVELAQYVVLHQKLQRSATTVADLMTRDAAWTAAEIDDMFAAVAHVATPFDIRNSGVVIMTGLTGRPDGNIDISWQRSGAGTLSAGSEIGSAGQVISPPSGLTILPTQTVVAAEVKFDYDPIFLDMLDQSEPIYYRIYFRPRRGGLSTLN